MGAEREREIEVKTRSGIKQGSEGSRDGNGDGDGGGVEENGDGGWIVGSFLLSRSYEE